MYLLGKNYRIKEYQKIDRIYIEELKTSLGFEQYWLRDGTTSRQVKNERESEVTKLTLLTKDKLKSN